MPAALVLVDLQNDFLRPEFALGSSNFTAITPKLLPNIETCVTFFRRRRLPIIWIRSEYTKSSSPLPVRHITRPGGEKYEDVPLNTDRLAGSHHGYKRICEPGSTGADFHPSVKRLVRAMDPIVTKTYFSAFTDTSLHQVLLDLGVDTLFMAGVTVKTCVRASVTDAFFHGYNVNVIKTAVSASSPKVIDECLGIMATHYASIIHHGDLESLLNDPSLPTLYFVNGSIPSWRVQLLLAAKHIAYNPRRLHVMSTPKQTRAPAFAAINPRCKTPTLVDKDGTIVIESLAILQYLETFYRGTSLTPSAMNKTEYTSCLQRFHESENLHNVCEGLEYLFLDDSSTYKREVRESLEGTEKELAFWEAYLSRGHPYVAGDLFTIADCALWPVVGYLLHRGLVLEGDEWRGLSAYAARISEGDAEREARPLGWESPGKVSLFKLAEGIRD